MQHINSAQTLRIALAFCMHVLRFGLHEARVWQTRFGAWYVCSSGVEVSENDGYAFVCGTIYGGGVLCVPRLVRRRLVCNAR